MMQHRIVFRDGSVSKLRTYAYQCEDEIYHARENPRYAGARVEMREGWGRAALGAWGPAIPCQTAPEECY